MKPAIVILSEVSAPRRGALTQSKDPFSLNDAPSPRKAFSRRPGPTLLPAICGLAILFLASFAPAQTLTGTVKNSTTGKPAAGDEVILLKLGQGMEESGRTKADAKGQFSFKLDDAQSPHLVRVVHEDVTYHRMAPPGTTSVEVEVYDAAKKVEGISVVADILRFESQQGKLVIVREFGVQNASKPPRTQMNEHNLEFYIPDGAQVIPDSATAVTEGGNPLKTAPVPEGEKNRYSFIFPLRPGLTRFEVAYQQPYTGSANIDPKEIYPLDHFVVMTPKAMQFTAAAAASGFKLINYPAEPDASVQVASNTKPGENLSFKVSGEGVLQAPEEGNSGQGSGGGAQPPNAGAEATSRPGGGLGPPIDAPDPLQKYRWWILGGFAAVLVIGGVFVASRQQAAARAQARQKSGSTLRTASLEDDYEPEEILAVHASTGAPSRSRLLDALKEELFQLEVERRQGQISQAEYETAKSALDQTLERALKREGQRA
ncbi:MAG: carboxypeptidase regulatory-like domain-containing protein [Candidatus Sulfotelmatobacter sp.]